MRLISVLLTLLLLGPTAHAADDVPPNGVTPTQCGPADSGAPCGGDGPASQGNTSDTNQGAGNPINLITGNKYQREVDLPALPGVLGLEIVRHYNSVHASPRAATGILGRGWRLSYETDLNPIGNTLQIMQADGTRIIFIRNRNNPNLCATNNPANGTVTIHKTLRGDEYRWTWSNGRILSFNTQGKLTQIKAPTGEFVSLIRDLAGVLVKVTDPQGRSLVLGYPGKRDPSRFNGVTHIESPVGRFSYAYGSAVPKGYTGNPRDLLANLVAVTFPNTTRRLYHYEDAAHATLLTGLSVAGQGKPQRMTTWAYDSQGRGILSVKGLPRQLGKDGKPVPGTGIEQVNLNFAPGKTTLTNSLGQQTTYRHAIVGNEHRLLDVRGPGCASCGETNVKYGYDKLGRLTDETQLNDQGQPLSNIRTERDAQGRAVSLHTVAYLSGKAQPGKLQVRYEYAGDTNQPSLIARPSVIPGHEHQVRISTNALGQPTQVTETGFSPLDEKGQATATPISRTTTYTYQTINGRSLLSQIDGPLKNGPKNGPVDSDITRIEWNGRGDYQVGTTRPGNLASRIEARDTAGRPTTVREADGLLTRLHYTYSGQALRIERAGRQVDISYDSRGMPVQFGSNDGQTIRIAYLPEQGKLRYTLPDGQTLEETHNSETQITALGWLDREGKALGASAHYEYTQGSGQLAALTLPSGLRTTFEYDANGQLNHWQRGKASGSQRFDPQARLLEADVAGAKYRASTDAQAASLALTLPTGAEHTELVDDFGRVVQQTSPERGVRIARYDAADHTLAVTDAVRVMTARYDAAGRIVERRHQNIGDPITRIVRTTWQGVHLVRVDDPEQITQYTYDDNARRISEQITLTATGDTPQTHTTQYRYDALGRLHQTALPEGATLTYRYDTIGRVSQVDHQAPAARWWVKAIRWIWADYGTQPLIVDLKSDSAHGLLAYTYGNGEAVTTQHDNARRLTRRQDGVSNTQLAYNADEEIAQLTRNTQTLELGYDIRGRLQQVIEQGTRQGFTLDTNGNRLGQTDGPAPTDSAQSYAYRPASDQLLSHASQHYTYNTVGEPVRIEGNGQTGQDVTRTLAYGAMGELVSVTRNGKHIARYRYNQNRQRIAKTVNEHTTVFLWQGGVIAAEATAQGRIEKRYVYIGSRPVALIQYDADGQSTSYAIHTDHLGTPLQVTDADKQTVWQAEYDVYGRATVRNHSLHSGTSPPAGGFIGTAHASAPARFNFNLRLPGQYEDAETGWHYNFHRYYNPETGRYLTPDPIGLEGGTNLYGYVDGNPAGATDPWGLKNYYFGSLDPTLTPDPGAGVWDSTPATVARTIQKFAIETGMAVFPWPNAKAHLQHYFDNKGTTYVANLEGLIKDLPSAKILFDAELNEARAFVESNVKFGACYPISSGSASGGYAKQSENSDWYFAVGGYSAWGKGIASVNSAGEYTLSYEFKFFDRYNWDAGKSVSIGGITVTDAFMGDFHRMGMAQEFDVVGTIYRTVTWKKGGPVVISK